MPENMSPKPGRPAKKTPAISWKAGANALTGEPIARMIVAANPAPAPYALGAKPARV
jgi:hypothetical protein